MFVCGSSFSSVLSFCPRFPQVQAVSYKTKSALSSPVPYSQSHRNPTKDMAQELLLDHTPKTKCHGKFILILKTPLTSIS